MTEAERLIEIRYRKMRGKPITDEEFDLLSEWWRSGKSSSSKPRKLKFKISEKYKKSPFLGLIPSHTPSPVVGHNTLRCSWCGVSVSQLEATIGKSSKFYSAEELVSINPTLEYSERIIIKNQQVVACPSHALMIKPRVNRQGEIVHSNIQFMQGD
jgi:hypothetical protein